MYKYYFYKVEKSHTDEIIKYLKGDEWFWNVKDAMYYDTEELDGVVEWFIEECDQRNVIRFGFEVKEYDS